MASEKDYGAAWSADGTRLAFVSRRSGSQRVWVMRADGVSPEEVKDSPVGNALLTWLPDGRLAWPTPGNQNYRIRDLRTGRDEYLLNDDSFGWVFLPQFSPRGDQVAVGWNRRMKQPSDPGLWLLSWPGREERRLTPEELVPIGWSTDGEWIYASPIQGSRRRPSVSANGQDRARWAISRRDLPRLRFATSHPTAPRSSAASLSRRVMPG